MNTILSNVQHVLKHTQTIGLLELVCQALELTETQASSAKSRYEAVGDWLARTAYLNSATIYPQGSVALQTTVKPLAHDEFDLDLVCFVSQFNESTDPSQLKQAIGRRLKENGHYAAILEEKPRCWRVNYANEFHLDITPSIPNPACHNGGELVPDKKLQCWKASNPKGYRAWFDHRAAMQPRLLLAKAEFAEARNQVEALPGPTKLKGLLRRIVQLAKHHRNLRFHDHNPELAPISIIITTLAAQSYEHCTQNHVYTTELDAVLDVIQKMPNFIGWQRIGAPIRYAVMNETTSGENFAEKWNTNPALARAFYDWHKALSADITSFTEVIGLDAAQTQLSACFGENTATKVMDRYTAAISTARSRKHLFVGASSGLATSVAHGTRVSPNTFYGR